MAKVTIPKIRNIKFMQKIAIYPKTKLPLIKKPQEIWKTWEKAWGIWKRKKTDPLKYLKKTRKEWEKVL